MKEEYDIIIIGTGAAGLFTALSIPGHLKVLMITKDVLENSDSYLAQGGISVLRDETDYDTYFEDTIRAGRYVNKEESVRIMIESSREIIRKLADYGVEFDLGEDGEPSYTREGGHTIFRILHHKDETGKEITGRLIEQVRHKRNIFIKEQTAMIDIMEEHETAIGIVSEDRNRKRKSIYGKIIVLATGGIGGVFEHTTNFSHISGDSFAVALKHHIALENLNYIQIHPTTLYSPKKGRSFLISESVRGEGAILLNERKERFVDELLPRDVVTEAIKNEMDKYQSKFVYLDIRKMSEGKIKTRFPHIYERCLEEGYDLSKDLLPVTPAQHYLMGGIQVDTEGKTSMKHLFAVGETACNGVHGANRLASNSLLESLVFAKRAADTISHEIVKIEVREKQIDLKQYGEKAARDQENKKLIFEEIQRRDGEFYARWCDSEN